MSYLQTGIPKFFNIAASNKAWFPTPSADLTGTLTGPGKYIVGTGTLFKSELNPGDYLLNPTTDDVSKIHSIQDDTHLMLFTAMTTALSGTTCKRIKDHTIKKATIVFAGTGPGTIRGVDQATGGGGTWPVNVPNDTLESDGGVRPFLVTCPAATTGHIITLE